MLFTRWVRIQNEEYGGKKWIDVEGDCGERMKVFFFCLFFWGIDMEEGKVKIRVYEEEEREDQL